MNQSRLASFRVRHFISIQYSNAGTVTDRDVFDSANHVMEISCGHLNVSITSSQILTRDHKDREWGATSDCPRYAIENRCFSPGRSTKNDHQRVIDPYQSFLVGQLQWLFPGMWFGSGTLTGRRFDRSPKFTLPLRSDATLPGEIFLGKSCDWSTSIKM